MSEKTYFPRRGDVIHINFQPSAGKEFTGPHYAVVISNGVLAKATGLCICCPCTTKHHPELGKLMVELPAVKGLDRRGWVYVHQLKTCDFRERGAKLVSNLMDEHPDFLMDLMDRVRALIDPDDSTR